MLLALVEVNRRTRKRTKFLLRFAESLPFLRGQLQQIITESVNAGSIVVTNSKRMYGYLSDASSGFNHQIVHPNRGELSYHRVISGENVLLSCNAAVGLLGQLKKWRRRRNLDANPKMDRCKVLRHINSFSWHLQKKSIVSLCDVMARSAGMESQQLSSDSRLTLELPRTMSSAGRQALRCISPIVEIVLRAPPPPTPPPRC